ncbi:hypothetical protein BABINDRAFT_33127 [Babjeviella inositovora NRRL Y-12698]|uniref:Ribokinase n=1 Tax=Babjeviella inositovora NRRL Y-12698 TaxID=984486 RepID=A0A1E3QY19_9ASCO|nr:uncharacterized protein BABINDRAFT_33127 [Babjeviella inositovora NRRL Y-12698]ODQ81992.1 hypothetical protein BABINDRAFT_33127 [Babjeviella inositovora NRRL Y-12698]
MTIITVIGSLNKDLVTYTNKVPGAGETYQANAFQTHNGGKGLNEALATAKLLPVSADIKVRMVGRVGNDSFGQELKGCLADAGVDVSQVTEEPLPSGVAVILVEASGENRILITPGANGKLSLDEAAVAAIFPVSEEPEFVILQNEQPDPAENMKMLKKNNPAVNIAYNPSPFYEVSDPAVLGLVDVLIINEGEAADLAKSVLAGPALEKVNGKIGSSFVEGYLALASLLVNKINGDNLNTVVITLGAKGAIYANMVHGAKFYAAEKVAKVVDTTGAGDTFLGAIVGQLALDQSIDDLMAFASKASSIVIQREGAAESIPTHAEVLEAMK